MRRLTNIFTLMTLLVLTAFMSSVQAHKDINELQYVKTYDTELSGKSILRIEIGIKSEGVDYSVRIPTSISSIMFIDLENTVPGKVKQHNSGAIQLNGNESISIKEVEINHTKLQLKLPLVISESSYSVYTELPNRKEKLPYRIIIDIEKPKANEKRTEAYSRDDNEMDREVGNGCIVIDPGHGGSDSGAVGPNGVTEKSVTLAVAKKVQHLLEKSNLDVVMTRTTDIDVAWAEASNGQELQARVNKTPPDAMVFVSIHCNAFSNPATSGMETYYYHGSAEGRKLATLLNEELENFGGRTNRGVKGANFYVLKHSSVPASLIELAFVTNPQEEMLLADDSYQEQLALAITRAIKRYLGIAADANFE